MKIKLRSFSAPGTYYSLDTGAGRCSCPVHAQNGWCKHLEAVGQYRSKAVTLSARPSFSQALSGVVKGIRIRNVEEAAYWLRYCWTFNDRLPGSQYRTVRRLLIGSAEDGHSVAVMERVSENFVPLLAKDVEFPRVLAELLRICKVPNWWHPASGGPDYIRSGMLASRQMLYDPRQYDVNDCLRGLLTAIPERDKVGAVHWVMRASEASNGAALALAHCMHDLATVEKHDAARRLAAIHLRHSKALSADNNFLAQAAWLLAGGTSQNLDQIEPVTRGDVRLLLECLDEMETHPIPGWCCDGIHCAGNDTRYMGMWHRMYAVCRQFEHWGRVSPDDPWLEDEFVSLEGLILGETKQATGERES